jgi:hypothetical protein
MRLARSNEFTKFFLLSSISSSLSFCLSRFNFFTERFQSNVKLLISAQFTLRNGDVFRVPYTSNEIHVLSGSAWLTIAGEDIILNAGEKIILPSKQDSALLSALGNEPLILEVL